MLTGLWGRPFVDLTPYLDLSALPLLDAEITHALTQVRTTYTGGSHRFMGIVPPSLLGEPYADYGEVIANMTRDQFATFVSLSDEDFDFDLDDRAEYEFGEERDHPLSQRQMRWLEYRFGVYFPWKVFYQLMPSERWEDKADPAKTFTREARAMFPRTVGFVRGLPFERIGRCNILGLHANDHGTVHRDGDPEAQTAYDQFVTFCPGRAKRLFLWDEDERASTYVSPRAYWFNDHDYHGVSKDPYFRYSIRVDGVFRADFLERLERDLRCT